LNIFIDKGVYYMENKTDLEQKIRQKKQEFDIKQREIEQAREKEKELNTKIRELEQKVVSLRSEAKSAENKADELDRQRTVIKGQMTRRGSDLAKLEVEFNKMTVEYNRKRAEAQSKLKESKDSHSQCTNLKDEKYDLNLFEKLGERDTLKKQFEEMERKLVTLPAPRSRFSSIESVSSASLSPSISPSWNLPQSKSPR
jgi:chromosome segregation ATPase